jgi:hypothetical protein
MDFIERYLGFSPDNGDGSFEAMLLIVLVTIITGISLGFFGKHHVCNWLPRFPAIIYFM